MSDLNVIVLDPLTQSYHFEANCGRIQYVSDPLVHLHLVLLRNICFISLFFFVNIFSLSESSRSFLEPLLLHCNKDEDQFSHLPRNHSPNKTIKNYYNW